MSVLNDLLSLLQYGGTASGRPGGECGHYEAIAGEWRLSGHQR